MRPGVSRHTIDRRATAGKPMRQDMGPPNFFETNRRNWDERVPIHVRDATGFYNTEAIVAGRDTLGSIEADRLGGGNRPRLPRPPTHTGLDKPPPVRPHGGNTGVALLHRATTAGSAWR